MKRSDAGNRWPKVMAKALMTGSTAQPIGRIADQTG
jgi:hypothetical protein